ncbi:MAG: type IV secretion system DNA-binding domain-containing protein [Candidatus Moranbacteria bacterium]|nr:type IV secretion system DNA-binding domain-containing protein [Candidatus Moranbacteria bacterium]
MDNNKITTFAKTNFRGQERVFGIKQDDRRRHFYVVGKTGTGKTTMIQNMAIQDIQNGRGVAVVDPHGEFAEMLIQSVPASRINDVIYFNPADQEWPIAFNVMEKVDTEYRHLIASGLVGVFKKIWADSWGPRLEYILRNAILALLEYPGSTLLGVTRILVDKNYRERVVEKITDPVVKAFWVDEFTKWNDRVLQEVISPIQNKVGQFLSSALIRNIVGQTKSAFNIRDLMDQEKIIIMNLSKGRIGEDNSALLGAMMITKIQLAAMARVDMPEEERKDFYLYVDEFQNFATDSFANILSEARKYHLNLIIAHQYVGQLMTDTSSRVRDAVFGNVGTLCAFRVGAEDAEFLEKEFEPVFMAQDLVNLPNRHIYIKLMIDGIAGNAFSAATLPPIDLEKTKPNEEKVIKVTRERYGTKREIVEEKIARWSGMITEKDLAADRKNIIQPDDGIIITKEKTMPAKKFPTQDQQQAQGDKKLYPAVCASCDTEIMVPFKPDGTRPTFCKDCLKDYQRQQARVQQVRQERNERPGGSRSGNSSRNYSSKPAPMRTISLQDAAKMNPKSFHRENRPRKEVDLKGVRNLIQESLNSKKDG